jgi:hypothetical protein
MRAEYDFSNGKRGVFVKRFPPGVTFVALDEDIRKSFPTEAAVNDALRALAKAVRTARTLTPRETKDPRRAHFDFATGTRGAFLKRFPTGVTLIALDKDVQKKFPTAAAANRALRPLAKRRTS